MTHEAGMRLGELEGIVGEEDGYSAESDAAILLQGLDIADELHDRKMAELQGGQKVRVLVAQALFGASPGAAARRADEPPRPRLDPLARGISEPVRGHADRHLARSAFSECRVHAHRRHRLSDDHHLHRRLRRHGGREDADSLAGRSRQRAARKEDRAAHRLHSAIRRRHARQPGDGAPQGSRAAADDRARALEHPAPVYQVHDEAAVRQSRARVQGAEEIVRQPESDSRIRRGRQPRREDRARRPQRRRQDDDAEGAAERCARHAGVSVRCGRGQDDVGTRSLDRLFPAGLRRGRSRKG